MAIHSLVEQISKDTGIIQRDVDLVLSATIAHIRAAVSKGDEVRLRGFGVFKTRVRAAKTARNLGGKTNGRKKNPAPLLLPPCTVPHFKPSKKFLKAA